MNYKDIKTYADFVEFYSINKVLCNDIIEETGVENWELANGDLYEYLDEDGEFITREEYEDGFQDHDYTEQPVEVYQWYIIRESDAQNIIYNTEDEILMYNEKLNLYVWGITHYGTNWDNVPISLS